MMPPWCVGDACLDGSGVEISIYRSPYGVILLMLTMLGLLALSARYLLDLLPFLLRKVREKAEAGRHEAKQRERGAIRRQAGSRERAGRAG